ncbi:MAG: glycosyltransferase [Patescibacteria group bacterium]
MNKVAAIIPAYNEELTIAQVVSVLKVSPSIQEVIVISDGSTDNTAKIARDVGATVFEIFPNGGKGEAMRYGLTQTKADIIAFFDADLLGLTQNHVDQLVSRVVSGERMMNIGLRDRGRLVTALTAHLPLISGERAMRRCVFEAVPSRFLKGFMIESALNYYCRSSRLRYGSVKLKGLTIRRKYQKVGFPRAVLQYARMSYQIVKAMILVRRAHL